MKPLLRSLTLGLGLSALAAGCEETPPAKVPVLTTAQPTGTADKAPPKKAVASLAQRDPASRVVAFRVVFQSGSADDPPGREGLTALAAQMIAASGTEALTFGELSRKLYPFAASISVNVERDETVFSAEVAAESLEAFYPILRDVLLTPRFDKESFERLRSRAVSRLTDDLKGGNDEALGKEALQAVLYPGHPYGHPAVGTERGLAGLSLEDALAHKKRVFCTDRVTAGVAGGFPDGFEERVAKDLGALPACEGARAALPAPKKTTGLKVTIVDKPSADAMAFSLGFTTEVTRASEDFAPVAFFTSFMGLHRQSAGVLYNRLREARGFNYGDYMYPEHFEQEGWGRFPLPNIARRQQMISLWLRPVKPQNGLFALRGALHFYREKLAQGVPDEELGRFRGFLSRYIGLEQQTPSRRLGFALDDAAYGQSTAHIERLRAGWAALTSAKLKEVVDRRFTGTDLTIVIVTKDGAALKAALVKGDKSPPTYDAPKPKEVTDEDRVIEALPLGLKDEDVTIWPIADVFK